MCYICLIGRPHSLPLLSLEWQLKTSAMGKFSPKTTEMHMRLCCYSGLCSQNWRQNKVTISRELGLKTAVDKLVQRYKHRVATYNHWTKCPNSSTETSLDASDNQKRIVQGFNAHTCFPSVIMNLNQGHKSTSFKVVVFGEERKGMWRPNKGSQDSALPDLRGQMSQTEKT